MFARVAQSRNGGRFCALTLLIRGQKRQIAWQPCWIKMSAQGSCAVAEMHEAGSRTGTGAPQALAVGLEETAQAAVRSPGRQWAQISKPERAKSLDMTILNLFQQYSVHFFFRLVAHIPRTRSSRSNPFLCPC